MYVKPPARIGVYILSMFHSCNRVHQPYLHFFLGGTRRGGYTQTSHTILDYSHRECIDHNACTERGRAQPTKESMEMIDRYLSPPAQHIPLLYALRLHTQIPVLYNANPSSKSTLSSPFSAHHAAPLERLQNMSAPLLHSLDAISAADTHSSLFLTYTRIEHTCIKMEKET